MNTSLAIFASIAGTATATVLMLWFLQRRRSKQLRLRNNAKRFADQPYQTHLSSYNDGSKTIVREHPHIKVNP